MFVGGYLDLSSSSFGNHGSHTRLMELVTRMPLALSFVLIGFFIWIAENIATFFGAWEYPNQTDAWSLVHLGKVSSWLLLVIVSFLIVATLKQVKGRNSPLDGDWSIFITVKYLSYKKDRQLCEGRNSTFFVEVPLLKFAKF